MTAPRLARMRARWADFVEPRATGRSVDAFETVSSSAVRLRHIERSAGRFRIREVLP